MTAGGVRIRLVATDLDGTLLRSDASVSDRTRSALRAATVAGLTVAFVTGRVPRWLDDVAGETGHLGVAVGANGAVVYDMATEQVLLAHLLDVSTVRGVADELRAGFDQISFAVETLTGFAAEPGYVHDWAINPPLDRRGRVLPPPRLGTLDDILTAPALKLLAKDRDADADDFLHAAAALVAGRASLTHSAGFGLLEIGAAGVTKATGLAEVASRLGVDAGEVVAIGDMPNDLPMLAWAGTSYAVANAHPAVRAAADHVIGSNDEDAVAQLIENLLTRRLC